MTAAEYRRDSEIKLMLLGTMMSIGVISLRTYSIIKEPVFNTYRRMLRNRQFTDMV